MLSGILIPRLIWGRATIVWDATGFVAAIALYPHADSSHATNTFGKVAQPQNNAIRCTKVSDFGEQESWKRVVWFGGMGSRRPDLSNYQAGVSSLE